MEFYGVIYGLSSLICEATALYVAYVLIKYIIKKPVEHWKLINEFNMPKFIPFLILGISIVIHIITSPIIIQASNYHSLVCEPNGAKRGYYVVAKNDNNKEYVLPAEITINYREYYNSQKIL